MVKIVDSTRGLRLGTLHRWKRLCGRPAQWDHACHHHAEVMASWPHRRSSPDCAQGHAPAAYSLSRCCRTAAASHRGSMWIVRSQQQGAGTPAAIGCSDRTLQPLAPPTVATATALTCPGPLAESISIQACRQLHIRLRLRILWSHRCGKQRAVPVTLHVQGLREAFMARASSMPWTKSLSAARSSLNTLIGAAALPPPCQVPPDQRLMCHQIEAFLDLAQCPVMERRLLAQDLPWLPAQQSPAPEHCRLSATQGHLRVRGLPTQQGSRHPEV
mmetsp:Transcript_19648/g.45785  ORF Transcript_19648/g.45785 Transcript_19648/m.45785 type:complete len:273 (-) Transcript_19648:500-1318(-)